MRCQLSHTAALVACLTAVVGVADRAAAITITLDYSNDAYFATNLTAKATLQAAANDLGNAITSTLQPLTVDAFSGHFGSTNVTLGFQGNYTNPSTGAVATIAAPLLATNEVRVFVGTRNLPGSTLGIGGSGGISVDPAQTTGSGFASELVNAVNQAEALANSAYARGGGPMIARDGAGGSFTLGAVTANYSIDYGSMYGNLWFDLDGNNDGVQDSAAQLDNFWHFDSTTPVAAGQNDLYSVALHELLHAIGFGASASWNDLASGTTWLGSQAAAAAGGGANLLTIDSQHVADGKLSTRISDGAPQEAVMDPSLTIGTRKTLTALDLAFLRDIGWQTITPTIPGDFNHNGIVNGADLTVWKSSFGPGSGADANSDGKSDGADLLIWQRHMLGAATATLAPVPEPSTVVLTLSAMLAVLRLRRVK